MDWPSHLLHLKSPCSLGFFPASKEEQVPSKSTVWSITVFPLISRKIHVKTQNDTLPLKLFELYSVTVHWNLNFGNCAWMTGKFHAGSILSRKEIKDLSAAIPGGWPRGSPGHLQSPPTQDQYSSTSYPCPSHGEHNLKKISLEEIIVMDFLQKIFSLC